MKVKLFLFLSLFVIAQCSTQEHQKLPNFHVEVPFKMYDGILIDAVWGEDTIVTMIDNHSPTWINIKAFDKIKPQLSDYTYRTTTADGTVISGKVYEAKNLRIGSATFPSVFVYLIDDSSSRPTAVIGEDILIKGAVKLDFRQHLLTFSNTGLNFENTYPVKSDFDEKGVSMTVTFSNNVSEQVYVDLAYNHGILLPEKEFERATARNESKGKLDMQFSTPAGNRVLETLLVWDSVVIDRRYYGAQIASNKMATEKLIGLGFFSQFRYLTMDYQNRRLLVAPYEESQGQQDFKFLKNYDTTIVYSIEGLSAEGSEVTVRYVNKIIRDAVWIIYGETGRREITYMFFDGFVKAIDKTYQFRTHFSEVNSSDDVSLKDSISYTLDFEGHIRTPVKVGFVNLYPDLKDSIPFALLGNK